MKTRDLLFLVALLVGSYSAVDRLIFANRSVDSFGVIDINVLNVSEISLNPSCENNERTRYEFKLSNNELILRCAVSFLNGQHITFWPFYHETTVSSVSLGEYPKLFDTKPNAVSDE